MVDTWVHLYRLVWVTQGDILADTQSFGLRDASESREAERKLDRVRAKRESLGRLTSSKAVLLSLKTSELGLWSRLAV